MVEGRAAVGAQEHFYLEPNVTVCEPREEDEMILHATTQVWTCICGSSGYDLGNVMTRADKACCLALESLEQPCPCTALMHSLTVRGCEGTYSRAA